MQPPAVFQGKFQDPDPQPLTYDVITGGEWRKMCSVAHNLQASPFLLVI